MCERFVLGMCARCAGMCAACAPHVLLFLSSTHTDLVTCAHVRPCAGVCALSLLTIHVVPPRSSPLNAVCDCAHMCVACAGKLVHSLLYGQRDIWRCSRRPHRSCLLRLCPHMPAHGAAHARTWHRSWPRGHTGPRAAAHARTAPHSRPHMPPCPRPARPHMAAHPIADGRTCPHMAPFVAARPHRAARGRTCPHSSAQQAAHAPCPHPAPPHIAAHPIADGRACPHMALFMAANGIPAWDRWAWRCAGCNARGTGLARPAAGCGTSGGGVARRGRRPGGWCPWHWRPLAGTARRLSSTCAAFPRTGRRCWQQVTRPRRRPWPASWWPRGSGSSA